MSAVGRRLGAAALAAAAAVAAPPPAAAAGRESFSARVQVAWVDHAGQHSAELDLRVGDGTVRIEGPAHLPGGPGPGTVLQDSGWSLLAPAGDRGVVAELARKYQVERAAGPLVAGRPTTLVVLRRDGRVREELAVDTATGLVLRRQQFGPTGRAVRVVTVLRLDTAPAPGPAPGAHRGGPRALARRHLPAAYRGPDGLAGGFRPVAAYRRSRGVHLLYTDGFHGLSLFTEPGDLSRRSLPPGGEVVAVGPALGVRYTWPGGEVVTWQAGPVVHTLVGDTTASELLAAARSVPRPGRPPLLARLRGTCRMVAEVLSGGR